MGILQKIVFNPELVGCWGIEQEFLICKFDGSLSPPPKPLARQFLRTISNFKDPGDWTEELSACQVEYRTKPYIIIDNVINDLRRGYMEGCHAGQEIGHTLHALEVGPEDVPLDVYDSERYRRLESIFTQDQLRAACRCLGVHIHYGCKDIEHAIDVYNRCAKNLDELCKIGDGSRGERIRLYKQVAKHWYPPNYSSVNEFEQIAEEQGFADDPSNCYHLIRISRHGTVECRMFGNTNCLGRIRSWIERLHQIIEM